MAERMTKSETSRCLSELLAAGRPWPVRDSLVLIHRLALQVQVLHGQGRTHRAIGPETVRVDEQRRPQLDAAPGSRPFGRDNADPEFCPPVLAQGDDLELPEQLDAVAAILKQHGHVIDPRSIDVYQLGTLLCRLLTGEPIRAYMYHPKIKGQVLPEVRSVLDRALGHDAENRFESCDALIEALDEAIRRTESAETPNSMYETPARGSVIVPDGDTPAQGSEAVAATQPDEDLPFQQLGHYRILERIGRGGMGDVYLGYDESLDRQVAIKVLPADLARDEDYVRRFHAEATAAAKVAHPNIVPVYFSGEDDGTHFFAMQFIEGDSLSQRLRQRGHLAVDEALVVAAQCLAGLEAAHGHGLIHRDIKPANILLDHKTGRAMLVDFGLVRRMGQSERMTATGTVMGTVDYIAPEQARGQEVDGRADVYSLGVLLYQMLSGRLPFEADTPTAMIFQHAYEEPFPLAEAAPDVPAPVIEMIGRMMAKSPADRHPDCAAVLADIEAFREGRPMATADGEPGKRTTTILPAPDASWEPELPAGLAALADDGRLRQARDWAATMFRRHAPEFVKDLQSTTQQVDGAVAHYERHRERLANLHEEARRIADELFEQLQTNVEAVAAAMQEVDAATDAEQEQAALAKKHECEEHIESLKKQHSEQQEQIEEIEHQLGTADAKLAQLRSQRDVLKARLRSAEARQQLEGGLPRARRPRWVLPAAIAGGLMGLFFVSLLLYVSRPKPDPSAPPILPSSTPFPADAPALAVAPFDEAQAKRHQQAWADYLGVPIEYTNSIGMEFALIPPGEFMMGSTEDERARLLEEAKAANDSFTRSYIERIPSEGPQHRVKITKPFWLSRHEVTRGQFRQFVQETKYKTDAERDGRGGHGMLDGKWVQDPRFVWNADPESKTDDHPVVHVSWNDATAFCQWLSKRAGGVKYELPTEAQWEYACRAGTTRFWHCGDSDASLKEYAWFRLNSGGKTHPVGRLRPNGFGLYDMNGNVAEWCADWYALDYYAHSPTNDPGGPMSGFQRVSRGYAWYDHAQGCRSAHRKADSPGGRLNDLGFRLASGVEKVSGTVSDVPTEPAPPSPSVPMNGLAGMDFMTPTEFPEKWLSKDALARITGPGRIVFPTVPTCRFVLETELTIESPAQGGLFYRLAEGGRHCEVSLGRKWPSGTDSSTVICRLFRTQGFGFNWDNRQLPAGKRLRLILVAADERKVLLYEGARIHEQVSTPVDLSLSIRAEGNPGATIHQCSLRELRDSDLQKLGWTVSPMKLTLDSQVAADRIAKQTAVLKDEPKESQPFLVKSIHAPMRWVPAGEFEMGSNTGVPEHGKGKHRVRLTKGFWMGQYEITQEQWACLFSKNPSRIQGSPHLPVNWVGWHEAMGFCGKLDALERQAARIPPSYQYRLPTEAEWEYACRAGSNGDRGLGVEKFWFAENSGGRLHEVGELAPNQWNLYDMHGNVAEWCVDASKSYPGSEAKVLEDPFRLRRTESDWLNVRGGAWWSVLEGYRQDGPLCADRSRSCAAANGYYGFRIVLGSSLVPADSNP